MSSYPAVVLGEEPPAQIVQLTDDDLPEGEVTVDVAFSTLNYKDGLAVSGKAKIARSLPMTCGIDFAGTVSGSDSADYSVGDEVLVTGWGLSETHPGGYTQRQRVPASFLVKKPAAFTLQQTMAIGTAGFTAMLAVLALEDAGVTPGGKDVLVTGAGGGVGSVAVSVLAKLGYSVAASTGRAEIADYLTSLGATTIVDRATLAENCRPLDKELWAGVVDTVGSQTLATVLAQTQRAGAVATCGNAGGNDLPSTVLPFILRGVALLGIDSVMCPAGKRARAWERLAADLDLPQLDSMTTVEPMSNIHALADTILAGQTRGRVVIDTHA